MWFILTIWMHGIVNFHINLHTKKERSKASLFLLSDFLCLKVFCGGQSPVLTSKNNNICIVHHPAHYSLIEPLGQLILCEVGCIDCWQSLLDPLIYHKGQIPQVCITCVTHSKIIIQKDLASQHDLQWIVCHWCLPVLWFSQAKCVWLHHLFEISICDCVSIQFVLFLLAGNILIKQLICCVGFPCSSWPTEKQGSLEIIIFKIKFLHGTCFYELKAKFSLAHCSWYAPTGFWAWDFCWL